MPIPTDTYRNIRVLNWLFAASAVLLVGVMVLSVAQDFFTTWRAPQVNARVWEAALVDDKIRRQNTPEKRQELVRLNEQIKEQEEQLAANAGKLDALQSRINQLRSDTATLEFSLNNRKAELSVAE